MLPARYLLSRRLSFQISYRVITRVHRMVIPTHCLIVLSVLLFLIISSCTFFKNHKWRKWSIERSLLCRAADTYWSSGMENDRNSRLMCLWGHWNTLPLSLGGTVHLKNSHFYTDLLASCYSNGMSIHDIYLTHLFYSVCSGFGTMQ